MLATFLEELAGYSGLTVLPSTIHATQWRTTLGKITSVIGMYSSVPSACFGFSSVMFLQIIEATFLKATEYQ